MSGIKVAVVVVVVVVVQCQSTRQLISCFIIAGSNVLGDCYRGDFTAREFNDQARRL